MVRLNSSQLRRRIKRQVDSITAERLVAADEFLSYLREREPNAATRELLRIPGLLNEVRRAEQDIARGKLTPVSKLRRKR